MIQKLFSVSDTGNSVIGITLVGSAFVSDHADAFLFDIRYGFCKISNRDCAAFADEERNLIQGNFYIVDTFWKNLLEHVSIAEEFYKHHFFRQIYVTADGILGVNRCDHDLITDHQLIFCISCQFVVRINEGKRFEVHIVV